MKIFVVLLAVCIAVQAHVTDEQKAKLKEHKEACISSSGVSSEAIEKAKKGEFLEDSKLNEFLFCLGKHIGFLNEAGEFQKDVIKAKIAAGHSAEDADAVVAACTTKTQATPQLTSLELAKCVYEQSKAHYSLA